MGARTRGDGDVDWLTAGLPEVALSQGQARVADVIRRNPRIASYADLAEVARRADVNPSTVVRTAQALGFAGWKDLQRELRARHLVRLSTEETLREHGAVASPLHDALANDIKNLSATMEANSAEAVAGAVRALADAEEILVVGSGSFAGPASVMAHLGSTMGYRIALENRAGVHLATAMNALGPGDAVVIINLWRTQRQLRAAAEATHAAGATIVAISDMKRGPLATVADHLIVVPSEGISFFQSVTAATSAVYGLLAGMEAAHPERSREALRRTQQLWKQLDIYLD